MTLSVSLGPLVPAMPGPTFLRDFPAALPAGLFFTARNRLSSVMFQGQAHLLFAHWLNENFMKWKNVLQLINVLSLFLRN